jgi:hypothetical protein
MKHVKHQQFKSEVTNAIFSRIKQSFKTINSPVFVNLVIKFHFIFSYESIGLLL